ncbi:hypothetical protein [Burkholderia anthina]|nr:hypothetical protein [Burkholderia anthina]
MSRIAIQRTGVFPVIGNGFAPGASIAFDAAHRAEKHPANR